MPRLLGSILLLTPRICEKRVYPRRLSKILLLLIFQVQLTPAICAREGANELKMSCAKAGLGGRPANGGPLCKLSPKM